MIPRCLADFRHLEPRSAAVPCGITVTRTAERLGEGDEIDALVDGLDRRRGLVLSSGVEASGRYRRFVLGFADPPLAVTARGRTIAIEALNARGRVLMPALAEVLRPLAEVEVFAETIDAVTATARCPHESFPEEERSRQPSVFSVLRALCGAFADPDDPFLGLYGAFAYDLAFQFEPIAMRLERSENQRDLVLYLPDELVAADPAAGVTLRVAYDFAFGGRSTEDVARDGAAHPYRSGTNLGPSCDHAPGVYQAVVAEAKEAFRRGDLFEAVPGQTFSEPSPDGPATVFRRLRRANPAPYEALINLGAGEFLVSASPEMFVRVAGRRIETCPISGTIARGGDAIGDAEQVLRLLNSAKDEAELTMCTDVDRNDKARICEPGSVRVLGRRMIEFYSRLIHTVDHVEGTLRSTFDALDAFLSHTWAVTVTGAPKYRAMRFLESVEASPRRWYGGAFGRIGFDGGLDTGLTLRTIRLHDGLAHVRVGATLLADSDPDAEDAECRLKASALFDAIRNTSAVAACAGSDQPGRGKRVLLVDHDDSFVHTLADYLRQTGAEVTTLRHNHARAALAGVKLDLVVLSPGPGRPAEFDVGGTLDAAMSLNIPVFGVCLGLQGIAERFGGSLGVLPEPMHGKASEVHVSGGRLFEGLPERFRVGRYHSLFARRDTLPDELRVTAETDDGLVMALEHRERPLAAVQFHPESIMTLAGGFGRKLIGNVMRLA